SSCRQMCSACFSPPSTGESWMRLYACSGSSPMTVIAKRPGTRPVSDAISRVAAIPLPIMTSRIVPPSLRRFRLFFVEEMEDLLAHVVIAAVIRQLHPVARARQIDAQDLTHGGRRAVGHHQY